MARRITLIHGDIRKVQLPEFHCIVTSPPYYRQRNYGGDGEMGQEDTPERYIEDMSDVFVSLAGRMHDDGTIFINIGDKYHPKRRLLGIPQRLTVRLMEKGLFFINEAIWHKRRIMPMAGPDRFSPSHEQILFFTKKPKGYTFNADAVKEIAEYGSLKKNDRRANKGAHDYRRKREGNNQGHTASVVIKDFRHCRTVWDFTTTNHADRKHSATFPIAIPERCVLAGSNEGDTVLDPFAGTCTTGEAAVGTGRRFVGVDTNAEFLDESEGRLYKTMRRFLDSKRKGA